MFRYGGTRVANSDSPSNPTQRADMSGHLAIVNQACGNQVEVNPLRDRVLKRSPERGHLFAAVPFGQHLWIFTTGNLGDT